MCGRFTQTKSRKEVLEQLGGIELPPLFHGRYNIAPAQRIAIIRTDGHVTECHWGFDHPKSTSPIINARIETLSERPMFKDLLSAHRCLIPADGFYEWKDKQPYYFQLAGRGEASRSRTTPPLFAFAGLWRDDHCVIITRAADQNMQGIHDRMPIILPSNQWNRWLSANQDVQSRCTIVHLDCTSEPPPLTARPVSRRVNKVANDDPACLAPADEQIDLSLFPDGE